MWDEDDERREYEEIIFPQVRARRRAGAIGSGAADLPPTLSNPTDTATAKTTAALGVDTNEGNGTLYWVVSTSATPPSAAQVKAGQMHTGAAAAASGSQAVSGTGTQTVSGGATGLTAHTAYTAHFMHEDVAANQSSVVSGDGFTTDFDVSTFGLDAIDNIYAAYAVARVLSSHSRTGAIIRARRSSDNAESDFAADPATGYLSASAIVAWRDAAGAATAFCTTRYDQSGNGRNEVQATAGNQPTIITTGAFPFLQTDGADVLTPAVAGWARNISAASLIAVVKYAASAAANQQAAGVNNNGAGSRAALLRAGTGASSVFRAAGRRLDADSLQTTTGLTGDDNWHVQIARFDWANSDLHHRVDGNTESNTSFQTAGSTSDTDSAQTGEMNSSPGGGIPMTSGGQHSAAIYIRDLLNGTEDSNLATSLAALKAA